MKPRCPVNRVIDRAVEAGLSLSPERAESLTRYATYLQEAGSGLSTRDRSGEAIASHIEDSLAAALVADLDWRGASVIDIGTGAGLPGIPLSTVFCPFAQFTLLDRSARRRGFVRRVLAELAFPVENPQILTDDAERLARAGRQWEIVLARALAPPHKALKICMPLVSPGGTCVLWIGNSALRQKIGEWPLPASCEAEIQYPKSLETRGGLAIIRNRSEHD